MNILLKSASENNTDGCHAEIRAEDLAMSIYVASQRLTARLGVRVVCQISSYPILGDVLVTYYTGTHGMDGQIYDVRMHRLIQ